MQGIADIPGLVHDKYASNLVVAHGVFQHVLESVSNKNSRLALAGENVLEKLILAELLVEVVLDKHVVQIFLLVAITVNKVELFDL